MKVCISRDISKLGRKIPCVSLPAGETCPHDAPCYKDCYAHKGRFSFKNVREAYKRNLEIYKTNLEFYMESIIKEARKCEYFRWHSAGDIPDTKYLDMVFDIAEEVPNTKFLVFTKRFQWVNEKLNSTERPTNLSIVFSRWGCFVPDNIHNLPQSAVLFTNSTMEESGIPEGAIHCPKYCGDCVNTGCSCWDLKPGQVVYFDQH